MARRTLIWHLGLAHPARPVIGASLEGHRGRLAEAGLQVAATAAEARLATHELVRTHREAGLSRTDVEGRWARVCDRVWRHKGVSVLSTPDLAGADKDQLRLALDQLSGVEVHLVVTLDSLSHQLYGGWLAELRAGETTAWEKYAGRVISHAADGVIEHRQAEQFWAGHDPVALLARWAWTIRSERVHVLVATDPAEQWGGLLDVAGVGHRDDLPVVVPAYADPAGVAVLRRVNRQLERPVPPTSTDVLSWRDHESAAVPVVETAQLQPVLAAWSSALDAAGYDVRGDLLTLTEGGEPRTLPGHRDQLGVAVDALADALAENDRLRREVRDLHTDNARLDRKRRKHKRRVARLTRAQD